MPRPAPWTIADLLDFEYLLAVESQADDAASRARDRALFAEKISPLLQPDESHDRRAIFRHWIDARRAAAPNALPGPHFAAAWQSLTILAAVGGLAVGISLTAGLLHYKGDEPVNVAWFFAWTVGLQIALLTGALILWLLRKTGRFSGDFRPLRWILSGLLWSLNAGLRKMPGPQREQVRAGLATISQRREIFGSLAMWPLLVVTQWFGVLFNIGILATLLLHVALSDVAFGWQSTFRTSPEDAFRIANVIAKPWSTLPHAHPALPDVLASRFSYSEGIAPLSREAMASWWPFLFYSVVVYGLLVRTSLLTWATLALRRGLGGLAFDHQGCNALFRRLVGPVVQAQADAPSLQIPDEPAPRSEHTNYGRCFLLFANDLVFGEGVLAARCQSEFGWTLFRADAVQIDHPSANTAAIEALADAARDLSGFIILVPAKRAPIKAISIFLSKCSTAAGTRREAVLLLVGRPEGDTFAEVKKDELTHWRNFAAVNHLAFTIDCWRPA